MSLSRLAVVALVLAMSLAGASAPGDYDEAYATITQKDVDRHLLFLASAELEGRDTPSAGLSRAAAYIEERMVAAGLTGAGPDDSFRLPFGRHVIAPVPAGCALSHFPEPDQGRHFTFGEDFVPLPGCTGTAEGELVFVGFGIRAKKERYDDLKGKKLRGKVAVLIEGEPRHRKLFDGAEVTRFADVHGKIEELEDEGAVAVLVVRRELEVPRKRKVELEPRGLAFRHTWASWVGEPDHRGQKRSFKIPALSIRADVANELLGVDVLALARKADKSGRFSKLRVPGGIVAVSSELEERNVGTENVCGVVFGTDPELRDEYIVLGAHYDHIGVDARGRIGFGADDNASGTSLVIELAEAFAASPPRRSILLCAFAGEEDGLLGSKAFCEEPPVPLESMIAMLNFDMVGRGKDSEVAFFGVDHHPDLWKKVRAAKKLKKTGIKKLIEVNNEELFKRSDQYSFHEVGVPALFFFEAARIEENEDYHTYRDTIERVSSKKITNTARLAFLTAWLLAEDDDRPIRPR